MWYFVLVPVMFIASIWLPLWLVAAVTFFALPLATVASLVHGEFAKRSLY